MPQCPSFFHTDSFFHFFSGLAQKIMTANFALWKTFSRFFPDSFVVAFVVAFLINPLRQFALAPHCKGGLLGEEVWAE